MTHGGEQHPFDQSPNPFGSQPPQIDQRMIAPPNQPFGSSWVGGYPPNSTGPIPTAPAPTGRRPDPGSRKAALIALVVFVVSLIGVAVSQQVGAALAEKGLPPDPTLTPAQRVGPPAMDDPFDMGARLFTKMAHSGLTVTEADRTMIQGQILQGAQTPTDKFRAAIVISEALERPEEAQKQLETLEKNDAKLIQSRGDTADTDPQPTLAEQELDVDIALARRVWEHGSADLSAEETTRLRDRHGWYGTLLTTHGESFDSGERAKIVANAQWIIVLMIGALVVFGTAFFGGIIAAAVMGFLVMQGKIKPHFRRPAPGGSVYLETAAVFVLSFLAFKLVVEPIVAFFVKDTSALMGIILAMQWLLLPIIFWPRLRGVSWKQWRQDVGFAPVEGRSVIREIGAGIFGYFAALPVLALAMAITVLIVFAKALFEGGLGGGMGGGEGGGPTPPSNPIAEMISQAPLWQLLMLFALATVWAPIVEECIFRGCLFRHMRSRIGVLLAAFLSAGAFAFMHGYAVLLLLPVFTIGLIFAFIREWRGSIISTVTAHAMHNATVLGLVGALFMILRG